MKKYYAVKVGRKQGIFNSWEECKKQVEGFSGASYKSFLTLEDAKEYMNLDLRKKSEHLNKGKKSIDVYVDGSYNASIELYSYGCIFLDDIKTKLSGVGTNKEYSSLRNVAGELLGTMEAIKWANNNNYEELKIYHDYEGISKWATGEWNATKEGTKEYVSFLKKFSDKIHIEFVKVKAHSGDRFNEVADILAKNALNNYLATEENKKERRIDANIVEKGLFDKIMSEKDKRKNVASFTVRGYQVTESKLIKVAKEEWKRKGYEIKYIDSIKVNVADYVIDWVIIDKNKREFFYSISLV